MDEFRENNISEILNLDVYENIHTHALLSGIIYHRTYGTEIKEEYGYLLTNGIRKR